VSFSGVRGSKKVFKRQVKSFLFEKCLSCLYIFIVYRVLEAVLLIPP